MKTECPHCNQHYEVENHFSGVIVKCENCGQEFVIEPLKEEPPPKLRKIPVAAATQAKPVAKSKAKKKIIFAAVALVVLALLGAACFQGSRRLAYERAKAICDQAELELKDIERQHEIERQNDETKAQIVAYTIRYFTDHAELSHTQAWELKNTLDNAGIDWRGLGLRLDEYPDKIIVSNLIVFGTAFKKQQYLAEKARHEQEINANIKWCEASLQAMQLLIKLHISKDKKAESQKTLHKLVEFRKSLQELKAKNARREVK